MDTIKIDHGETKMIAHRGVSGIELENTCASFLLAGSKSYFGIETDVHVTKDGKFIIYHDDDLKRIARSDKVIESSNYDEIKNLKLFDRDGINRTDYYLPSLFDYFAICKKYGKVAFLELKNPMKEAYISTIVTQAKRELGLDKIIFISFSDINLAILRRLEPTVKAQLLVNGLDDDSLNFAVEYRVGIDMYEKNIRGIDDINKLHALGIEVNAYTVDDPRRGEELVSFKIDYLTTDILE